MIKGILNFIQVNVGFGFDVESKQALQYFRDKGLRTSFSYADVTAQEHQAAFTVAKMMDMDLLKDVQDSLYAALAEGLTFDQWKDRIIPTLQANGWWGRQAVIDPITGKTVIAELGSARRLQTIFRTNMQSAYAVGQWQKIQEQAKEAPYLMYDAVDDFRTRPQHRAWDNKILPITSTFWTRYYPPNGWGCFLGDTEIDGDLTGAIRRFYEGVAVEILTASGRSIRVTANHPILTSRGWVIAEMINPGDKLLAYNRPVKTAHGNGCSGQVDNKQPKPSAKNLFKSMLGDAFAFAKTPSFKFNSDLLPIDGEINIDVADGGLSIKHKADDGTGIEKTLFMDGYDCCLAASHVASRSSKGDLAASDVIGSQHPINIPLGASKLNSEASFADFAACVSSDNNPLKISIVFSGGFPSCGTLPYDGFRALFEQLPLDQFGLGLSSNEDAFFDELSLNGSSIDHGLFGYLIDAHSCNVFSDPVVNVRHFFFSGHVYDFQSSEGVLSANGIIAHNCRCGVIQLSQDDIDSMGMSVSDDPDIKWVNWKNPRTGKIERIPEGIDAGFQINAGMEREKYLKKLAREKAEAIADDLMRDAAKVGLAKSVNVQKMTTPDKPSQPYAGLPPDNTDRLMDIVDRSVDVCDDMSVLPSFSAKNLESFVDSIRSYNKRFDQGKFHYIGFLNKKRWVVEGGSGALVGYSPDIDCLFVSREFLDDIEVTDRIETWKVSGAGAEYQWANVAKQNTIAPDLKKVILSLGGVQKYEFNPTLAGIAAHEFGHRIHNLFNSEIDAIVNEGFRLGWASAISQYATTNPVEMMAETMVVYQTGTSDDLRRIYPPLLDFLNSIDKEIER